MNTHEKGAATLLITVILMVSAILIVLYAGRYSLFQVKVSANLITHNQSLEAAEAGLEYGIVYLNKNAATVIASPSGGHINYGASDSNVTNVALANGSKFSVTYTNPTANTYTLLLVTATGLSADGSSTITIQQQVAQPPSSINYSVSSVGNITLVGGSTLTNTVNNSNISTGGTVNINNGASTITSSGTTSTQGHYGSDIQQNVASLQGLSESAYFQSLFSVPESSEKSIAQASGLYYSNIGPDYSQKLSGVTGKTIWIDQTNGNVVTLGQGVTIGSAANPVTIIVEGDLTIANGVTIYGFVYASGPTNGFNLAGGAKITGGIASANTMNISNGFQLVFSKFPLLAGSGSSGSYAKVPGSWVNF